MKLKSLILIMVLLLTCGSGCMVKNFKLLNGLVEFEEYHMKAPSLYKVLSVEKNKDGFAVDAVHFEIDPSTIIPEPTEDLDDPEVTPTP